MKKLSPISAPLLLAFLLLTPSLPAYAGSPGCVGKMCVSDVLNEQQGMISTWQGGGYLKGLLDEVANGMAGGSMFTPQGIKGVKSLLFTFEKSLRNQEHV